MQKLILLYDTYVELFIMWLGFNREESVGDSLCCMLGLRAEGWISVEKELLGNCMSSIFWENQLVPTNLHWHCKWSGSVDLSLEPTPTVGFFWSLLIDHFIVLVYSPIAWSTSGLSFIMLFSGHSSLHLASLPQFCQPRKHSLQLSLGLVLLCECLTLFPAINKNCLAWSPHDTISSTVLLLWSHW